MRADLLRFDLRLLSPRPNDTRSAVIDPPPNTQLESATSGYNYTSTTQDTVT
jgi:hypothetical protein